MKGFFVVGLSVLFVIAVIAYAVWRSLKAPSGCGCGCSPQNNSCSGCGTISKGK